MKKGKKIGLDTILLELKAGLSQKDIAKKYSIPKQTLSYDVGKLIKLKCVKKVGHGVSSTWKFLKVVPIRPKDTLKVKVGLPIKEIRGHAFIWNIEFLEGRYDWKQIVENYKKRYKKPTLSFKMICNEKVPRTIFKNRKIWLTKTGLTIYEPLDFLGKSSFTVKGMAVFEMDKLIKDLLKKLKLKLQHYRFKCSREHFAHVNNQMARQFNDKKQKIKVDYDGKWFWIDFSDGINEEETNDANVSVQAQKYYKSQMKTDFKVTPEQILKNQEKTDEQIRKNAKNLDYHAENMVSHVGAVKIIGSEIRELRKERLETKNILRRIANALEKK